MSNYGPIEPYTILTDEHPILRLQSEPITEWSDELALVTQTMLHTMMQAGGVGLAAPQVGISNQLFVFFNDDKFGVCINPRITPLDSGEYGYEGCLSIPGHYAQVSRANRIHVVHFNPLTEKDEELEVSGFLSRIFQHETDHLNGVLMTDYTTS